LKSASETVFPLLSGNRKSGAAVPSGSMLEGVSDMRGIWNGARNYASHEMLEFGFQPASREQAEA
jgi:hypothetical protein